MGATDRKSGRDARPNSFRECRVLIVAPRPSGIATTLRSDNHATGHAITTFILIVAHSPRLSRYKGLSSILSGGIGGPLSGPFFANELAGLRGMGRLGGTIIHVSPSLIGHSP
jgi:hypothetical protein